MDGLTVKRGVGAVEIFADPAVFVQQETQSLHEHVRALREQVTQLSQVVHVLTQRIEILEQRD